MTMRLSKHDYIHRRRVAVLAFIADHAKRPRSTGSVATALGLPLNIVQNDARTMERQGLIERGTATYGEDPDGPFAPALYWVATEASLPLLLAEIENRKVAA